MEKIKEIKLITAMDEYYFNERLTEKLKEGYIPFGELIVSTYNSERDGSIRTRYSMIMAKY